MRDRLPDGQALAWVREAVREFPEVRADRLSGVEGAQGALPDPTKGRRRTERGETTSLPHPTLGLELSAPGRPSLPGPQPPALGQP